MKQFQKHNKWISTEVIKVLSHNLNFSNWTGTYACEGKWELEFKNGEETIIEIFMPTSRWNEEHSGFFILYTGRMQYTENQVFIWQNDEVPVRLTYEEINDKIKLNILGHNIQFEKKPR